MSDHGQGRVVDMSKVLDALDDPVMGPYRVFGVPDTRPIYRELLARCPVMRTEHAGVYAFSMDANLAWMHRFGGWLILVWGLGWLEPCRKW